MRKITLKKIEGYNYAEMVKAIVENPGKRPYSVTELRQAVNLIGKIEKANDELLLEESEYVFLRDRVDSTEFITATQELLDFIDEVQLAPEVDVQVKSRK